MLISIVFDKNSPCWGGNFEYAKMFIKAVFRYFKDRYLQKGYIYLSDIYDSLGLEWDPYRENLCWICERDGELKITADIDEDTKSKITVSILKHESK